MRFAAIPGVFSANRSKLRQHFCEKTFSWQDLQKLEAGLFAGAHLYVIHPKAKGQRLQFEKRGDKIIHLICVKKRTKQNKQRTSRDMGTSRENYCIKLMYFSLLSDCVHTASTFIQFFHFYPIVSTFVSNCVHFYLRLYLIVTELTKIEVTQKAFFFCSLTIHRGNEMWNVNINANVSVRLPRRRTYRLEMASDTIVQYLAAVEAAA